MRSMVLLTLQIIVKEKYRQGYFRLIPESPRWLLSMRRREEACRELRKLAAANGVILREDFLEELDVFSECISHSKIVSLSRAMKCRMIKRALKRITATQRRRSTG